MNSITLYKQCCGEVVICMIIIDHDHYQACVCVRVCGCVRARVRVFADCVFELLRSRYVYVPDL